MKDAVIREWSCSNHEAIQQLLSFLMEFVVSHANSQVRFYFTWLFLESLLSLKLIS